MIMDELKLDFLIEVALGATLGCVQETSSQKQMEELHLKS